MWKIGLDTAPTGWDNFFLARPMGFHPTRGGKYTPTVVQQVGGELFSPENELDPLEFGQNYDASFPGFEWHELPDDPTKTVLEEAMENYEPFEIPVIRSMIKSIERQKLDPDPNERKYILSGFGAEFELNTIICFLKSFDDKAFNK